MGELEAQGDRVVTVGGDVVNSVIIAGDHNHIVVGSTHGDRLEERESTAPVARARPVAPNLSPDELVDREEAMSRAHQAVAEGRHLQFYGGEGLGKSTLLENFASRFNSPDYPDGVGWVGDGGSSLREIQGAIVDNFYGGEEDAPYVVLGDRWFQHLMREIRAVIVIDDVELKESELKRLFKLAPGCCFILAANGQRSASRLSAVALPGLSVEDSMELLRRSLGRELSEHESSVVATLASRWRGKPESIIAAAGAVRGGKSFEELAENAAGIEEEPTSDPDAQRIQGVLAASGGKFVSIDVLAAVAGAANFPAVLADLKQRHMVRTEGDRLSLLSRAQRKLLKEAEAAAIEPLLEYYSNWASEHRDDVELLKAEAGAMWEVLRRAHEAGPTREIFKIAPYLDAALKLAKRLDARKEMLQWTLDAARHFEDQGAEAWALHQLATAEVLEKNDRRARKLFALALAIRIALGDSAGAAVTRANLEFVGGVAGPAHQPSGAKASAATSGAKVGWIAAGVGALSVVAGIASFLLWPTVPAADKPGQEMAFFVGGIAGEQTGYSVVGGNSLELSVEVRVVAAEGQEAVSSLPAFQLSPPNQLAFQQPSGEPPTDAPTEPRRVTLSSSDENLVFFRQDDRQSGDLEFLVSAGERSAPVSIHTKMTPVAAAVRLSVSDGPSEIGAFELRLEPLSITEVVARSSPVVSGESVEVVAKLNGPAPEGFAEEISIQSSNASRRTKVATGSRKTVLAFDAPAVDRPQDVRFAVRIGDREKKHFGVVRVLPSVRVRVTLHTESQPQSEPLEAIQGQRIFATVSLNSAVDDETEVTLESTPALFPVGQEPVVKIPAGKAEVDCEFTAPSVDKETTFSIVARANAEYEEGTAELVVYPPARIEAVQLTNKAGESGEMVKAGVGSIVRGSVELSRPARRARTLSISPDGADVSFVDAQGDSLNQLTIPPGSSNAPFQFAAPNVDRKTTVKIIVEDGFGLSKFATVDVLPGRLDSVRLLLSGGRAESPLLAHSGQEVFGGISFDVELPEDRPLRIEARGVECQFLDSSDQKLDSPKILKGERRLVFKFVAPQVTDLQNIAIVVTDALSQSKTAALKVHPAPEIETLLLRDGREYRDQVTALPGGKVEAKLVLKAPVFARVLFGLATLQENDKLPPLQLIDSDGKPLAHVTVDKNQKETPFTFVVSETQRPTTAQVVGSGPFTDAQSATLLVDSPLKSLLVSSGGGSESSRIEVESETPFQLTARLEQVAVRDQQFQLVSEPKGLLDEQRRGADSITIRKGEPSAQLALQSPDMTAGPVKIYAVANGKRLKMVELVAAPRIRSLLLWTKDELKKVAEIEAATGTTIYGEVMLDKVADQSVEVTLGSDPRRIRFSPRSSVAVDKGERRAPFSFVCPPVNDPTKFLVTASRGGIQTKFATVLVKPPPPEIVDFSFLVNGRRERRIQSLASKKVVATITLRSPVSRDERVTLECADPGLQLPAVKVPSGEKTVEFALTYKSAVKRPTPVIIKAKVRETERSVIWILTPPSPPSSVVSLTPTQIAVSRQSGQLVLTLQVTNLDDNDFVGRNGQAAEVRLTRDGAPLRPVGRNSGRVRVGRATINALKSKGVAVFSYELKHGTLADLSRKKKTEFEAVVLEDGRAGARLTLTIEPSRRQHHLRGEFDNGGTSQRAASGQLSLRLESIDLRTKRSKLAGSDASAVRNGAAKVGLPIQDDLLIGKVVQPRITLSLRSSPRGR